MNMPGFTAEVSLSRTMGKYQSKKAFGHSAEVEALQMQEFGRLSGAEQGLSRLAPWEKRVPCCTLFDGRPYCSYSYVPVWYDCDVIYTPLPCWICRPPVYKGLNF